MFGNYFGKTEIVELMVNHSVAKKLYSEKARHFILKCGPTIFKLFGYPLSVYDRQRARVIMKYLYPKKGEKILDVGCGVGYYCFELATKYGCNVYGVDIDGEDIELANQISETTNAPNVNFCASDICELQLKDETFDKILVSEVLEHITDDDIFLAEMCRMLKQNGYLIISVPYVNSMKEYAKQKTKLNERQLDIEGGHIRNGYSLEKLNYMFTENGLDLVEYTYVVKRFTKSARFPLFLLMYPLSFLDDLLNQKGKGIILRAKKKPDNR